MGVYHSQENQYFVGRQAERAKLTHIAQLNAASIVIVYGRRRVGKTELLEQTFNQRNILKFEGIYGKSESEQRHHVMTELAVYAENPLLREVRIDTWVDVFRKIADYTHQGVWTLYFEEVQWLANYQDEFVSELKYAWDNFFRHNQQLILILCGSSPSFMLNQVVHSNALYNRSQFEFSLQELNPIEAKTLLGKYSAKDALQAYLTVGGIPEYLLKLKMDSSILLSLCQQSFTQKAYFAEEYQRIFVSSLANNSHYIKIIEFLSKKRFATRQEIIARLKISSGKNVTELLTDLELSGFIQKYTPYNATKNTTLARYSIFDAYLQFYFKFIEPIKADIDKGKFNLSPTTALNNQQYQIWLGYAFERFCRRYDYVLAKMLGFSAVRYTSGAFYNRNLMQTEPGFQIDLLFDRADNVITVCEIKYLQTKVKKKVVDEFEEKIANLPLKDNQTLQKVLITASGAEQSLIDQHYFDAIITLNEIMDPHYWRT